MAQELLSWPSMPSMLDDRSCRRFSAAIFLVVTGVLSAHCATPNYGAEDLDLTDDTPKKKKEAKVDPEGPVDPVPVPPLGDPEPAPPGATCTDDCATEGAKRCALTSSSGTDICAKASDGCRKWTPGADCEPDFTCNKVKNDGSCLAGCTNDPGCSASNVNTAHCQADKTTELTCTKVGACYVFKTTRTNVPQQCTTPLYCGPTTGRRINCVASAAGACTQHIATFNDCPAGTKCQGAGQCVSTSGGGSSSGGACTNACTKNASRCVVGAARSTQVCITAASGCTVWAAGPSCSPDETCTNGSCN